MVHALKIAPQYFEDIASGSKNFEIRKNDRNFAVGDYLAHNEWIVIPNEIDEEGNKVGKYTGRFVLAYVTYVLNTPEYVKDGYVALGIEAAKIRNHLEIYNNTKPQNDAWLGYAIY